VSADRLEEQPWRLWSRGPDGKVIVESATIPVVIATIADLWRCPESPVFAPPWGTPVVFLFSDKVTLPDVVGLPWRTAAAALYGIGFHPRVWEQDAHDDNTKVVAQDPLAVTSLQRGGNVRLHLAPTNG
jgi:hypothetical protein